MISDTDIRHGLAATRVAYEGVPATLVGYLWEAQTVVVEFDRPRVRVEIPREWVTAIDGSVL